MGGLIREFFTVMGREAFGQEAGLFAPLGEDVAFIHPSSRRRNPGKASKDDTNTKDTRKKSKDKDTHRRSRFLSWFGGKGHTSEGGGSTTAHEVELYKACGLLLGYSPSRRLITRCPLIPIIFTVRLCGMRQCTPRFICWMRGLLAVFASSYWVFPLNLPTGRRMILR